MRITYADVMRGYNSVGRVRIESDELGSKIMSGGGEVNIGSVGFEECYVMIRPYGIESMYKTTDLYKQKEHEIKELNEEIHYWINAYEEEVQKKGRNNE